MGAPQEQAPRFEVFTRNSLHKLPQIERLSREQREELLAVSAVLPFRVNRYVVDELIDWDNIPNDPIYQLTFPQAGMLAPRDLERMLELVRKDAGKDEILAAARPIQMGLNPHPAGQMELNVPRLEGDALKGMQHKYRETVLFFPAQGQTCHAYCTYCFRWAQFVGIDDLKFVEREADRLIEYLKAHPTVTDVLFTGGDPMVMKTRILARYIEPLLEADLPNLQTIRIGTKAVAYWPQRFVTDDDADDLLKLFERVVDKGLHLALMGHYSHPMELRTDIAQQAVRRIRSTGAEIRCQAPLIRHVNDDPAAWSELWDRQVSLGAIPYYMFVERDTGAADYFGVSLARAFEIFSEAYRSVSGLARTVRGPSMSATPGKVLVDGVAEVEGQKVFVLKFLQGRDPDWVNVPFFAEYDENACWLDDLRPAFGGRRFFFEEPLEHIKAARAKGAPRGAARVAGQRR